MKKYNLFEGFKYASKWKSDSELFLLGYCVVKVLLQMTLIHLNKLNETSSDYWLFYVFTSVSQYVYYKNYSYVDHIHLISLCALTIIILGYLIMLFLVYKRMEEQWKGLLLRYLLHFYSLFTLPIISFSAFILQNSCQQQQYYFCILGVIGMGLSIGWIYVEEEMIFTFSFLEKRKFYRKYYFFFSKKSLILIVLTIYVRIANVSSLNMVILTLLLLVINCLDLWFKMTTFIYFNRLMFEASIISCVVLICFYWLALIQVLSQLLRQNLLINLTMCSIGFYVALKTAIESLASAFLMRELAEIKSPKDAETYIRHFYHLSISYKEEKEAIILAALIYSHRQKCDDPTCCCWNRGSPTRPIHRDKVFLKPFALMIIQKIYEKFQHSMLVSLTYITYKVEIMRHYPLMLQKIKKIQQEEDKSFMSIMFMNKENIIFEIRKTIEKYISLQLQKSSNLDIKKVFQEEQLQQHVKNDMMKMLTILSHIYKFLNRAVCNLNSLNSLFSELYRVFLHLNYQWNIVKLECKSLLIFDLFYFYFHKVLDLNFEYTLILDRMKNISKKLIINQKDKIHFNYLILDEVGAVLFSLICPSKMGIITQISKNGKAIFGLQNSKIIGMNIQNFFLPSLRKQHHNILKKWCETARDGIFNRGLNVFMLSFQDTLFHAQISLQILLKGSDIYFSCAVIKINDQDFMAVDQNGNIQGYGKAYIKIFPQQFRGRHFSLVCDKWKSLISSATREKQKSTIRLKSFTFSNKTVDFRQIENTTIKAFLDQAGQYSLDIEYFLWSIGTRNTLIIKTSNIQRKSVTESRQKINQFFLKGSFGNDNQQSEEVVVTERQNSGEDEEKINGYNIVDSQSRSSMINDSMYSISKTMKVLYTKAQNQSNYFDREAQIIRYLLVLFFCILLILIGGQLHVYSFGLSSFHQLVKADGTVNNYIQLIELSYNKVSEIYEYCQAAGEDKCEAIKKSTQKLENWLHSQIGEHFKAVLTKKTFLNHFQYQYQLNSVTLMLDEQKVQVQAAQLIELYIYGPGKIIDILNQKGKLNKQADIIYKLLREKWYVLKQFTHESSDWYKRGCQLELQTVQDRLKIFVVVRTVIFTTYILVIYMKYHCNERKQKQILFMFRLIPLSLIEGLKVYYHQLCARIKQNNTLSLAEVSYPNTNSLHSSKRTDIIHNYSLSAKFAVGFLWCLAMILNIEVFLEMNQIFPQCQGMLNLMEKMMKSETELFENYYEIRAFYLEEYNLSFQQFEESILETLASDEILFNKEAISSLNIFQEADPSFTTQISSLLIQNICDLISKKLDEEQIESCRDQLHFKLIDEGLLVTLNYFQRSVYQAFFDLQNKADPHAYFKQKIFQDLDNCTFYMIQLYKLIENRMEKGLIKTLQHRFVYSCVLQCFEVFCLLGILIGWLMRVKVENFKLSQLNGYTLFLPKSVIRDNKIVQKTISKHLLCD